MRSHDNMDITGRTAMFLNFFSLDFKLLWYLNGKGDANSLPEWRNEGIIFFLVNWFFRIVDPKTQIQKSFLLWDTPKKKWTCKPRRKCVFYSISISLIQGWSGPLFILKSNIHDSGVVITEHSHMLGIRDMVGSCVLK